MSHYWYRSLNYILRIPFRELLGNVSRPYDPTAPLPLADVPLNATIVDTHTHTIYTNPYTGERSSNGGNASSNINNNTDLPSNSNNTTRSRHYLPQIRKAWSDRTSSMSWAISTAFFSSVLFTVLAVAALVLNWEVPSVYLKIFLVAFVVRKWIATILMADRALYRLPLNLTEPDPDIDEERHNGVAIYMSHLFTWHGYAMLIFGQFYVLFYASSNYLSAYPIITGVALCYWGLVQRQAISRMNGGYQSEGTTNTTDLNQVERSLEDVENGRGGGFGAVENLKLSPAMMAIPIVVYKKPGGRPVMTSPSAVAAMTAVTLTNTSSGQQPQQQQDQVVVTGTRPDGDQPVALAMPQPRRCGYSNGHDTQNDILNRMSANLSIIYNTPPTPSCASPRHGRSRSSTTTGSVLSSNMPFIPCTSSGQVQEMTEVDTARRQTVSPIVPASTPLQTIPSSTTTTNSGFGSGTGTVAQAVVTDAAAGAGGYPTCVSEVVFPERHQRDCSTGQASNTTTKHSPAASRSETPSAYDSTPTTSTPLPIALAQPAIASLPAPLSIGTLSVTSSKTSSPSVSPLGSVAASVAASIAEESDDLPQPHQAQDVQAQEEEEEFNNGDQECAICLSDFEDGDELRHLYCNHLFHRNCVDRWLVRNAFCPKCKRGI
ncbi:hypothetical protein BGX30_000483 [Mortierella sp. GBA39]|nr:hypothetical protein BGX30_000483 [Mortierella sp. GBA39]